MSDDKELTTEEKAALIGKEHDKEPKEDIPDYDVTEDDGSDENTNKEDQDDKRLGKSRNETDHRKLSNREKRQLRKKNLADRFDAKDNLIKQQAQQINELAGRLNAVDGKLSQVDQAALERSWQETQNVFFTAEKEHADAFSNGDGAKATAAMRKMYEAQKRLDELQAINARNQQVQPARVQQAGHDPLSVNKAQEWAASNPWFKQGASDDDSAIADAIAAKMVREGYDPRSDDYWDELDDRLSQKGIGSKDEDEEQQDQNQSQREKQDSNPAKRRTPPVSGGGGRGDMGGGKVQITLPTAYINALKENGMWDVPETRNRMIKRYVDGVKQREGTSR